MSGARLSVATCSGAGLVSGSLADPGAAARMISAGEVAAKLPNFTEIGCEASVVANRGREGRRESAFEPVLGDDVDQGAQLAEVHAGPFRGAAAQVQVEDVEANWAVGL